MQSSKATEHDAHDEGASLSVQTLPLGEPGASVSAMPYAPSAPCAACARGVDPLRAACLSMTDTSLHYFCSRACRASYVEREVSLQQRLVTHASKPSEPRATIAASEPARPRTVALEPVARRITPAKPETPLWPLFASAGCLFLGALPVAGADQLGVLGMTGVSAVFASRAGLTRRHGGLVAWLLAPVAVALLGLAALLGHGLPGKLGLSFPYGCLVGAALAIVAMWWREHLLERAQAIETARRGELAARLSPRARVSESKPTSDPAHADEPRIVSDRALARLCVGDELLLEPGSVAPVDGIVLAGEGEVLPYPNARLAVERKPGSTVLAGARLTQGTLRVGATKVGDQRALFRVLLHEPDDDGATNGALSLAQRVRTFEFAFAAVSVLALAALALPAPLAAKLASLGGALVTLPLLALARGIRGAYRRAFVTASTRGIHYREPASLERAGRMDTAVLRVEGTLVPRSYTLLEVATLSDTHDAPALLALALAAEAAVKDDGIAQAVRDHAARLGVPAVTLRRVLHTRGRGVSGLTDGQGALVFGSRAALLSAGVSVAVADREAQRAELLGQRVVFLALGGRARGLFVFAQSVRSEATVALQTLFDLGLEVALVSGDHRTTVEAIARTLDIRQVKAELSAEQRVAEVRRLRDGEAQVVVVGRLPEDPSLLAAADVSLCLDATGQAGEHDVLYDVTTASPDLRDAAAALVLARRVRTDVRTVQAVSAVGGGLALLVALGVLPPALAIVAALAVDSPCLAQVSRLRALWSRRAAEREDAVGRGS